MARKPTSLTIRELITHGWALDTSIVINVEDGFNNSERCPGIVDEIDILAGRSRWITARTTGHRLVSKDPRMTRRKQ